VRFWDHELQLIVDRLLQEEHFDIIWVNFVAMAVYLERWLGRHAERPLLLLDQHNVDEIVWKRLLFRSSKPVQKIFAALQLQKVRRFQKRWFPRFDAILSVSLEDLELTKRYVEATQTELWVAPNGADVGYFQPVERQARGGGTPRLIFGGSMDAVMNEDAVSWFVRDILPRVRSQIPTVQFWIVGRNPPSTVRKLAEQPGVRVTGGVPDIRPYYQQADVFVAPVRLGGGTKLKVLEAMAMGLAIVSTTVGAQGLAIESGRHAFIADDAEAFAEAIIKLLEHPAKAVAMGKEARKLVEQQYSWQSIIRGVEEKLLDLSRRRH